MTMVTPKTRPTSFNIRLSEEEWARLDRLKSHYGINAAGIIRMLLKREDDAIGPPKKKTKKGAK